MQDKKIAFSILIVLVVCFTSFGAVSAAINDGLVAYYPFNGNANDESGNGNGGVVTGAVLTTDRLGSVNSAYSFNNNGDAVIIGNPTAFQLQDFSIAAWVKRGSSSIAGYGAGGDGGIFDYGSQGFGLGMFVNGRPYLTKVGVDNVDATSAVTDLSWHHVVVTKIGSDVAFYIDGVNSGFAQYYNNFQFDTNIAIGTRGDLSPSASFIGSIDEVRLYNRALTATEIALLADKGVYGCINLKGTPVVNSQVSLKQTAETTKTTSTDNNGCFNFSSIVSGKTFTLQISGPTVP